MIRAPRNVTYYRLCGTRIRRGLVLFILAVGILWFISGTICITVGGINFDDTRDCWEDQPDDEGQTDPGYVCWDRDDLVTCSINTIGGIALIIIMAVTLRRTPEVRYPTGQVIVTTSGYPQQPGQVIVTTSGYPQQPGAGYYQPPGPQQPLISKGYPQSGVPNQGYVQPGMPNQGYGSFQ